MLWWHSKAYYKNIKEELPIAKCIGVYSYMRDQCAYRKYPQYCKRDLGILTTYKKVATYGTS